MVKQKPIVWGTALLFLILTFVFGNYIEQSNFSLPLYFSWFGLYLFIVFRQAENNNIFFFLFVAGLARVILIPAFPLLSDDIYRFIWDGRLILNGENPFHFLPTEILNKQLDFQGLNEKLLLQLNSPNYYTIYPPLCQAIFGLTEFTAGNSIQLSSFILKTIMVGFEIGTLYFLYHILLRLQLPVKASLLYALNPLIIIEISGNLHFEGAMIFFLSVSIFFMLKKKWIGSAFFFALSVASKLLPLMFLPLILKHYGWEKGIKYCLLVGLFSLLLFIPLLNQIFVQNFSNSLDLYFQKFEFNASIYYIGRWIGELSKGYNIIQELGPALGIISFLSILLLAFWKKLSSHSDLLVGMLFSFCIYLFLGTTIHPWYLSVPIFLSCFTNFRFVIFWSALIMLTYLNYCSEVYSENLGMVTLEYFLVFGILIWELRKGIGKNRKIELANRKPISH